MRLGVSMASSCPQITGGGIVICGALVSMVPDWISPPCERNITEFEVACYHVNESTIEVYGSHCYRIHHSGSEVSNITVAGVHSWVHKFLCKLTLRSEK